MVRGGVPDPCFPLTSVGESKQTLEIDKMCTKILKMESEHGGDRSTIRSSKPMFWVFPSGGAISSTKENKYFVGYSSRRTFQWYMALNLTPRE